MTSFRQTVQNLRTKKIEKRNSLILQNIKNMNNYIASINELSPIIFKVANKRRQRSLNRKYSIMVKSRVTRTL